MLLIDYEFWVTRSQLPGHIEVLRGLIVPLQGFVGEGPAEIGVCVFWLPQNNLVKISQSESVLAYLQVALCSFVVILRLLLQLYGFGEGINRLFKLLKIGKAYSQVVVDIWFNHIARLELEGTIQIFDGVFELFIFVVGESPPIVYGRVRRLLLQSSS